MINQAFLKVIGLHVIMTAALSGHSRAMGRMTASPSSFSHRSPMNTIMTRDSYKKFDLMQKIDVHLCSNWTKSRPVETFWCQGLSRKCHVL